MNISECKTVLVEKPKDVVHLQIYYESWDYVIYCRFETKNRLVKR